MLISAKQLVSGGHFLSSGYNYSLCKLSAQGILNQLPTRDRLVARTSLSKEIVEMNSAQTLSVVSLETRLSWSSSVSTLLSLVS